MTKKERIIVPCIGAVLLAIFTFTDLPISMALFTKNLFGRIFEVIGEVPFAFFAVFSFALLFRFRSKKTKAGNIVLGIVFAILTAAFALMGGFMTWNYLHENIAGAPQFLAVLFTLLFGAGAVLLSRSVPPEKAREAVTFAIIAIIYFVAVIIIMNVVKGFWGRMRIREMTDPLSEFTRWYVITPRGGFNNEYASFPSGHAMNAAGSILLCLLPSFVPKLYGKETLMKAIAYAWMIIVPVSRLVMGAHFASDITVGVLLSLLIFEVTRTGISKARKLQLPVPKEVA